MATTLHRKRRHGCEVNALQPTLPLSEWSSEPPPQPEENKGDEQLPRCVPELGHRSVVAHELPAPPQQTQERQTIGKPPKDIDKFVQGLSAEGRSRIHDIVVNLKTALDNSSKKSKAAKAATTAARDVYIDELKKFVGTDDMMDITYMSWRKWLWTHGSAILAALERSSATDRDETAEAEAAAKERADDLGVVWR